MMAKPDWGKTFSRTDADDGDRVLTHSALVPVPGMPGALVRLWMEERWTLRDGERVMREERTCYWYTDRAHAYATLEKCMEEAVPAAERGEIKTWMRDAQGGIVLFEQPVNQEAT